MRSDTGRRHNPGHPVYFPSSIVYLCPGLWLFPSWPSQWPQERAVETTYIPVSVPMSLGTNLSGHCSPPHYTEFHHVISWWHQLSLMVGQPSGASINFPGAHCRKLSQSDSIIEVSNSIRELSLCVQLERALFHLQHSAIELESSLIQLKSTLIRPTCLLLSNSTPSSLIE